MTAHQDSGSSDSNPVTSSGGSAPESNERLDPRRPSVPTEVAVRAGSDEGVLGPPGKHTHTTADGGGSRPLPRSETKRHKYRTFDQGISKTTIRTAPLLILLPTFGNFQRKQLSPIPKASEGPKSLYPQPQFKKSGKEDGPTGGQAAVRLHQLPTALTNCLSDSMQGTACLEPLLGEKVSCLGAGLGGGVPAAGEK